MLDWLLGVAAGLALVGLVIGASHLVTLRHRHGVSATGTLLDAPPEGPRVMAAVPDPAQLSVGRDQSLQRCSSGRQIDLSHVGLQLTGSGWPAQPRPAMTTCPGCCCARTATARPSHWPWAKRPRLLRVLVDAIGGPRSPRPAHRPAACTRPWRSWPRCRDDPDCGAARCSGPHHRNDCPPLQAVAGDEGARRCWTILRGRTSWRCSPPCATEVTPTGAAGPADPPGRTALRRSGPRRRACSTARRYRWRLWAWRREDRSPAAGRIDPPTTVARWRSPPSRVRGSGLIALRRASARARGVAGAAPRIGDRLAVSGPD